MESQAAIVNLNFRAGSTFPVPVCTVPSSMDRTSRCNKVDAVRLYASYRLNLLLLKGQRCVECPIHYGTLKIFVITGIKYKSMVLFSKTDYFRLWSFCKWNCSSTAEARNEKLSELTSFLKIRYYFPYYWSDIRYRVLL